MSKTFNSEDLTKFYYTIRDVAKMFALNESTLRYWENEFHQLHPTKNRKGDRRYRKEDILVIDRIYILLKERKFTLEGAKKELKQIITKENKKKKVIIKLKKIKKGLEKINSDYLGRVLLR